MGVLGPGRRQSRESCSSQLARSRVGWQACVQGTDRKQSQRPAACALAVPAGGTLKSHRRRAALGGQRVSAPHAPPTHGHPTPSPTGAGLQRQRGAALRVRGGGAHAALPGGCCRRAHRAAGLTAVGNHDRGPGMQRTSWVSNLQVRQGRKLGQPGGRRRRRRVRCASGSQGTHLLVPVRQLCQV